MSQVKSPSRDSREHDCSGMDPWRTLPICFDPRFGLKIHEDVCSLRTFHAGGGELLGWLSHSPEVLRASVVRICQPRRQAASARTIVAPASADDGYYGRRRGITLCKCRRKSSLVQPFCCASTNIMGCSFAGKRATTACMDQDKSARRFSGGTLRDTDS